MTDEIRIGDAAGSALTLLAAGAGYTGSLCLFIGGLATFFPVPLVGQIGYLNGPTGSGILFILCACLSAYITWSGRYFLLYLSGGIAGAMAGFDILNATRLGYVVQMALGGGLSASMGGTPDPIVAGMMENSGFSIPTGWMVIAAGIFILMITPSLVQKQQDEKTPVTQTRDQILETRMKELDNLIMIYERGHISRDEFNELKKEIMGRR